MALIVCPECAYDYFEERDEDDGVDEVVEELCPDCAAEEA